MLIKHFINNYTVDQKITRFFRWANLHMLL